MHRLLPHYDRDARLALTLTCAGLGGCCSDGGAGEKTTLRPPPIGTKMETGGLSLAVEVYDFNDQD